MSDVADCKLIGVNTDGTFPAPGPKPPVIDWQPIETLPKVEQHWTGACERVLFATPEEFIGEGYWSTFRKSFWTDSGAWRSGNLAPTHWAPMPSLPTAKA